MDQQKIYKMRFSTVYPLYIQKAVRKGRTKEEVDRVISWLTGYTSEELQRQSDLEINLETFVKEAPCINPKASLITGLICGIRIEDIQDEIVRIVRCLDKLVDELAKGKPMEKILRT
ncbi:DUF2200 domain-containing protein [Gracilinema caldarium]|uniref:Uncharacterized conserved protein UCP033199 n=1 Tax=Gracilinema caldarium (strain ATCC 51460 / DSM 7334 / H1) TaxID=744872 RepID=F8F351_GRAC1|nr:DUF2200 domain-containing protein [Gracilinema caldarium]AEJ20377.1 Uncharacterized conserved protein UCP033199 [Gracilinema caldarium DSM 7334]